MKKGHSGQRFKFDISLVLKMIQDIQIGVNTRDTLLKENGLGDNKVDSYIEYLAKVDGIKKENANIFSLTNFGKTINNIKKDYSFVEQLFLYKLGRGDKNGGHLYYSILLNFLLYDISFKIDNKVSFKHIDEMFKLKFSKITVKNKSDLLKQALNQGLCETTTGFGKMGMVALKDGLYEISGYKPHKLVTAYIIYDNWPKSRAALSLDEIRTMDYFPGKIFFMFPDDFKRQLYELTEDRLLYIEKEAGLDQVRLSPSISKDSILERIVEECQ